MIKVFIATADPGLPLEFLELPEHLMNAPTIDEEDSSNYKCFHSIATTRFGLDSQETYLELYEGVLTGYHQPTMPQRLPGFLMIMSRRSLAFCRFPCQSDILK